MGSVKDPCGYVTLYRYDPRAEQHLTIDSKEPDYSKMKAFMMRETRFNQLIKLKGQEAADALMEACKEDAMKRRHRLVSLAKEDE